MVRINEVSRACKVFIEGELEKKLRNKDFTFLFWKNEVFFEYVDMYHALAQRLGIIQLNDYNTIWFRHPVPRSEGVMGSDWDFCLRFGNCHIFRERYGSQYTMGTPEELAKLHS